MPSDPSTVAYLVEQMSRGNEVRAKRMFGEVGLYCAGRFIGIIADDRLYLKDTEPGRAIVPDTETGRPYPKARPHLLIDEDVIEDVERLGALVRATAEALPRLKPRLG